MTGETLLTEAEAQTKWCPLAAIGLSISANNPLLSSKGAMDDFEKRTRAAKRCRASDCMMWRWSDARNVETYRLPLRTTEIEGSPVVKAGTLRVVKGESWRYRYTDVDADGEFELLERTPNETKRGYCGLTAESR